MKLMERTSTPEKILEAAGEVFADRGFHAATVREITKRAGVNVAAVNYHFRDKEELYLAVLRHSRRPGDEQCDHPEEHATPAMRLEHFIGCLLKKMIDPRRPAWHGQLMAREMATPTRAFTKLIDEDFRPRANFLNEVLSDLGRGKFTQETLDRIAASVIGQCIFYRQNRALINVLYPSLLAGEDPLTELRRHITSFTLAAIHGFDTLPTIKKK